MIDQLKIQDFLNQDDKLIVYVGRMVFKQKVQGMVDFLKGYEIFLSKTKQNSPYDIKLIFLGDGKYKYILKNYAKLSKFSDDILIAGYKPNTQDFYSIAEISGLTSYVEGFPNVILESMISGVPCLCTNVGEMQEMVADSGMIVKRGDYQDIAKQLEIYFGDQNYQKDLKKRAFLRVKKHYNWVNIGKYYQKQYSVCIERNKETDLKREEL